MTTVQDSTVKCFAQLPSTVNTSNTIRRQTGAGRTPGISLLIFSTEYGERDENPKYFGTISKNFIHFSGTLMLP